MGYIFRLTFMNMKLRKARTFLTLLGVIIGVVAVVSLLSLGVGISNAMMAEVGDSDSLRQIIVESPQNKKNTKLKLTDHNIQKIEKIDKVEYIYPRYEEMCYLQYEKFELYCMLTGIPSRELSKLDLKKGSVDDMGVRKPNIILGSAVGNFIMNYDAGNSYFDMKKSLEDLVDKKLPAELGFSEDNQKERLKVVGVLSGKEDEYSDKSMGVYCDLNVLTDYLGVSKSNDFAYTSVVVMARDIESVDFVVKKLKDMGYETTNNKEYLESVKKNMKITKLMLGGIGMIAFIVAIIGISNTMTTAVYDRIGEIGLLKVLGCNIEEIRFMFLMDSGFFGLLGGILGVGISYAIKSVINKLAVEVFMMNEGTILAIISPGLALGAIAFSTLFGILAGYIPARWASKLSPIKAINLK